MKSFFPRWLKRSLTGAFLKGAVSTASLAVVSCLIFCLVSVSSGIGPQLGRELSAYGANIILLPKTTPLQFGLGSYKIGMPGSKADIRIDDLKKLRTAPVSAQVENYAPGLVANVKVRGADAGAAGYAFDALKKLNPLWRVEPRWPGSDSEAMIGEILAGRLGIKTGDSVEVSSGSRKAAVRIVAMVETGGGEDMKIFVSLAVLQRLTDKAGSASMALVRVKTCCQPVDKTGAQINEQVPGVEARTLRQVASAEESLLKKVSRLLWFVTIVVSVATAFTVAGTIGVLLLGRRREIGLCMALGATAGKMRLLFLSEAAFSGLAGGLAGCLLGAVAAEAVSRSVFGTPFNLGFSAALPAVAAPLLISVFASLWPVVKALRISPCEALREQ